MELTTPRIAPLPESEWDDETRELLPKGTRPLNVFTTLVRHPKLFKRWSVFAGHVLSKSTLPARERELAILRTGHRCRCAYEFHQHKRLGLSVGLTEAEIARVTEPGNAGFSEHDAAIVRAADELHDAQKISDETWSTLRKTWDEKQMIDLLFAVGQYTMVSMVLNSLGVQIEDAAPGSNP
ncbi:MAG TPA: carboxymuconolactone decarboxylase family protein [Polyangiales bacterium]|nr:carboxymuconolactone decarboxylase family protein [Polyangiales bacterium]